MYQLQVYYPENPVPHATLLADRGSEVLELIQAALAEHPGCERVVVTLNSTRLFAIDCAGNRLP